MRRVLSFLALSGVALGSVSINPPSGQTTQPYTLPNATEYVAYPPVTFSATETTPGVVVTTWSFGYLLVEDRPRLRKSRTRPTRFP